MRKTFSVLMPILLSLLLTAAVYAGELPLSAVFMGSVTDQNDNPVSAGTVSAYVYNSDLGRLERRGQMDFQDGVYSLAVEGEARDSGKQVVFRVLADDGEYPVQTDPPGVTWQEGGETITANLKVTLDNPPTAPPDPTASPAAGSYTGEVSVTLGCSDPEAVIYYTTDTSDPAESETRLQYSSPILLSTTTVVKAVAEKNGKYSQVKIYGYIFSGGTGSPSAPSVSPAPGSYKESVSVTLGCSTPDAQIYYTTNGTDPVSSYSKILYESPVQLSSTTTLKAVAKKDEKYSQVKTFSYEFQYGAIEMTVSMDNQSMTVGETRQVKVETDITGVSFSYSSNNTGVAIVSSGGWVSAKGEGEAVIMINAKKSGYDPGSDEIIVTVSNRPATISITPSTITIIKGQTKQLTPSKNPYDSKVTYSSSDNMVATVSDSGLITAIDKGKATITAVASKDNYDNGKCTVEVTVSDNTIEVGISPAGLEMKVGEISKLTAKTTPTDAAVSYTSGNPGIATVSQDGTVTALSEGAATITASASKPGYQNGVGTVTVRIGPPEEVFYDVPNTYWASDIIAVLIQKGIIGGYVKGQFKPENRITRAEFTRLLTKAIKLADESPAWPSYNDVDPGAWYFGSVEAAAKAGLMMGYENSEFRPEEPITRQEMAVVLVRAMGMGHESQAAAGPVENTSFVDDQNIAPWARDFVVTAVDQELVGGYPDNTFRPDENATRAEACAMIYKLLQKK